MSAFDISVVVCTYNRAALLAEALASLQQLRTDGCFRYEIVVVDNASTDRTRGVIAECARRSGVPVRGVCEFHPGVAFARNRGIREAAGPWIAFFDDDQEADPGWLLALWKAARQRERSVVGGAVRLAVPEAAARQIGPFGQSLFGATAGRDREQSYTRRFAPGTGNLLVHRSVFEQVGQFDTSLSEAGEDTDLYRRIRNAGIACWYTPAAVVFHKIPADRLGRGHLVRTAQRVGGHVARRERRTYGAALFPAVMGLRFVQTCVREVPRWLCSRFRQDPAARLDAECLVARSVGYFRQALRELAPTVFRQTRFFRALEFRAERSTSARAAAGSERMGV